MEPNTVPSIYKPGEGEVYYFSSWAADRLPTDGRMDGQTPTTSDVLKKIHAEPFSMHLVASNRQ
jgi:hypothetical protein